LHLATKLAASVESKQDIIDHANISHIFASGDDQHQMLQKFNKENKNLKIADLNDNTKLISQAIGWKQFLARDNDVSPENINERIEQIGMNELATIMYTSGTTNRRFGGLVKSLN
jgi:long-subunit acyl-CoA synthetase (AMP-forming)